MVAADHAFRSFSSGGLAEREIDRCSSRRAIELAAELSCERKYKAFLFTFGLVDRLKSIF